MHQKYTKAFFSDTNLVFIIVLKIAGFYISFSSVIKIIFHNFLCCFQHKYAVLDSLRITVGSLHAGFPDMDLW